ncbi:MAG: type II toxin-antitoxin system MqsA family antitoxin, partial [Terriglobales bacterium]
KCPMCGSSATETKETKKAKYRGDTVEVATELFRCDHCKEGFVTPTQMGMHVRAVKNEVRKKEGMLPPERIVEIRKKLELTQSQLEDVLGTGPKMVVRWESGKVIQSRGHDNMLRLLERDSSILKCLQQIQQLRTAEQKQYDSSSSGKLADQVGVSA